MSSSTTTRIGEFAGRIADLESRVWQKTNNWIETSHELSLNDLRDTSATWRSWAWTTTTGTLRKAKRVITREDAGPALPR
jgi:hypothetical protein